MPNRIVKKLVPPSVLRVLRRMAGKVLTYVARSGVLSSLYYGLFSASFRREHRGVLYGRLRYVAGLGQPGGEQYLLRRQIHRLEKGLLMQPRHDVFALEYIEEAVQAYLRAVKTEDPTRISEMQWAHDVLTQYFEVVGSDPRVKRAHAQFSQIPNPDSGEGCFRVPYKRHLSEPCSVTYDALLNLARRRRSTRWFLPRPVERDLIDQAVRVAALSPSACNRQPFEFHVFDDPQLVQRIVSLSIGTSGFAHNIPVLVVAVGKLHAFFSEQDRHLIYVDSSLATMSFMLALETLGLSSCCINWPDREPQESGIATLLRLSPDERPVFLIALGYPDPNGLVACSEKKAIQQLRRYN